MTKEWKNSFVFFVIAAALVCGGLSCEKKPLQKDRAVESWKLDSRSYQLGVIAAFAEIVAAGVKKLALSSPLAPDEMAQLLPDAEKIAAKNGILLYLEKDFCVTDLFPEDITEGKHVLLIYLDPIKDKYLALKQEKEELIKSGSYMERQDGTSPAKWDIS